MNEINNSSVYYTEVQKFRQPWLWALLLFSLCVVLYRGHGGIWVVVGVSVFLWFLQLETIISEQGISYRWLPFQRRPRLIKWEEMEKVTVRAYAPIAEFGGWGIRFSWRGTAQTVSGNNGIEIRKKSKRRFLLIGTQMPEQVQQILMQNHLIVL
ncbi:hypothetical protein [Dyadobacter sediminis]|uniref:Uncharacterized protein n=1 Tax=Dyadobacter sediminis TaxID=1493691 RepID=A0A5R9KFK0_9BACT|nr:hypothetical protein [Dyadobacter sediminis]TLU94821.1 hypothetical protein FEM55_11430 [Dyadobacter sediminis]GGB87673.1 hypothetical protein GCM10011325_14060 [Dyadobacter sediminis]